MLTGGSIFFDEPFSPFSDDDLEEDLELNFELVALTVSGLHGDLEDFEEDDLEDLDFSDFSVLSFDGFSGFSLVCDPFLPETVLP